MFIDDKLNHLHPIKVKKFPRLSITKTLMVKAITEKICNSFIRFQKGHTTPSMPAAHRFFIVSEDE